MLNQGSLEAFTEKRQLVIWQNPLFSITDTTF